MTMLSDGMLLGGEPTPAVFVSATSAGITNSVTITINKPAGLAVGDFLACIVWGNSNMTGIGSGSSGWTPAGSELTGNVRFALFTRTVDGTEGSSFTFTVAGGSHKNAAIIASRGGAGAIDVVGAETETGGNPSTAASIAATASGFLIAAYAQAFGTRTISTGPSGMTQRAFDDTGLTSATYTLSPSPAGSTGNKTLTWATTGGGMAGFQIQIY